MSNERIRFEVPGLAPASYSGNSRAHWRTKHRDGDEYAERVWCANSAQHESLGYRSMPLCGIPWAKAKLTLTQRAVRPRDHDNFLASFKPGLDTLTTKGKRPLGIIMDDTPGCLSIEVRTEKVSRKADEAVVVEIERVTHD